jgi:hypothetical protein
MHCDRCGQEFPIRQLNEAFTEERTSRERENLCPSCLDVRMNEADRLKGVAGGSPGGEGPQEGRFNRPLARGSDTPGALRGGKEENISGRSKMGKWELIKALRKA